MIGATANEGAILSYTDSVNSNESGPNVFAAKPSNKSATSESNNKIDTIVEKLFN